MGVIFQEFEKNNQPIKIRERAFDEISEDLDSFLKDVNNHGSYCFHYYFYDIPDGFKRSEFNNLTASVKVLMQDKIGTVNLMPGLQIKELFNSKYQDPKGAVKEFASFLINCCDTFYKDFNEFSSPYISVVQSSLYGKTRLVREVARTYFRTVYVCLRDKNSTGYPERTEGAFTHLFAGLNDLESGDDFSFILADRFKRLISSALINLDDPRNAGGSNHKDDGDDNMDVDETKFQSELIPDKLWNAQILEPWTKEDKFPGNMTSAVDTGMVFLAIDEARYTLTAKSPSGISLFRYIRNAARIAALSLPNHIHFMVAFLDTTSRIQNFSPSSDRDCVDIKFDAENAGRVLFRPYILILSYDVFFESELSPKSKNLENLINSTKWLDAGRPIMKLAKPEDSTLVLKLQGGYQVPVETVDKVAIMLARVGAQVLPTHSFSSELVAGNMATLLDTNTAGDRCVTRFVSEPALARAAAKIWARTKMLEGTLLPALHNTMISGAFNKGRDGEVVAQIVLLLAFDAVCLELKKEYGDVVPLRLVIQQLLPLDLADEDRVLDNCIPAHLRDAKIACCQFINLSAKLDLRTIVELAEKHAGGVLKANHVGLDLFLPILFNQIAAVVVQVKAVDKMFDSFYPSSAGAHLRPSHAFQDSESLTRDLSLQELDSNCVRIYMQLGAKKPNKSIICGQVKKDLVGKPYPLQLFGLTSRCIKPSVRECLEGILIDHITWEGFQEIDKIAVAKSVKPTGPTADDPKKRRTIISFTNDVNLDDAYWDLTVGQLRAILKERKLKSSGRNKMNLVQRLQEADKSSLK